jgi:hypothetical protein
MRRQGATRKSHTVSNAIQFSTDGSIHSLNGDVLNKGVMNPSAMSDAAKANIGITVNQSKYASFNTGSDTEATTRSSYESVQLRTPDGKVQIGAYRTDPATVETLKVQAPEMFVAPEVKQAEAAKRIDAAREDAATAEDLGRHQDDALEGYHQHVVGEVNPQSLISLLVYGQRGEAPPADLLNNIARDMGESVESAITKVNAVAGGVHRQFSNLATAMGVDPEKAAVWLKDHRKDTSMAATQAHLMRRDVRAWLPLLEDYRMATGDGVKH